MRLYSRTKKEDSWIGSRDGFIVTGANVLPRAINQVGHQEADKLVPLTIRDGRILFFFKY